jgi:hypothetical protein
VNISAIINFTAASETYCSSGRKRIGKMECLFAGSQQRRIPTKSILKNADPRKNYKKVNLQLRFKDQCKTSYPFLAAFVKDTWSVAIAAEIIRSDLNGLYF